MKKSFVLSVIAAVCICACAQDIIVTKSAKKIDAKILEVSESEIKYQEADNLDGPAFVLDTKEINCIIYTDGKVVLYAQDSDNTKEPDVSGDSSITKFDINVENGYKYISEDGNVVLVYDKDKQQIYLRTDKPMMHNSLNVRNITLTACHFGDNRVNLVFDLSNKMNGIAVLRGSYAFDSNIKVRKYFKKNVPQTFVIDIPYETQQESYQMKLSDF